MSDEVRPPVVFVVDDLEEDRVYLCAILERAGYEVRSCGDAETGLEAARRGKPSLIVMDVQLPGISGLEATRRLKMDPLTARIPVVVVTAHQASRKEAREARYDAFLTKPVDEAALIATVTLLLESASKR